VQEGRRQRAEGIPLVLARLKVLQSLAIKHQSLEAKFLLLAEELPMQRCKLSKMIAKISFLLSNIIIKAQRKYWLVYFLECLKLIKTQ
jgi:hypothetical protein